MAANATINSDLDLYSAVSALLESPPPGTPDEVVSMLTDALGSYDRRLPAKVFSSAVDQSPVAISITDLAANIIYANPSFTRVTGYTLEDVRGKNESLLSDKNTPLRVYQDLWESITSQRPWYGTLVNRRKDSTRYLAQLIVTPVLGEDGKATHYLGMHRDVTEEHQLQQQVLNQKTMIESMVDAAPFVIALLDEEGEVVLDNIAYKTLATDMSGKEPVRVFLDKLRDPLGHALDWQHSRGFTDREVSFDPGGGRRIRWFSCSGTWFDQIDDSADSYFARSQRKFLLFVAKEISDLKQEQEKVRANALRALVSEQERMGGVREILAGALYQLQGPLNLLNAAVNLVERRSPVDPADKTLSSVMHQAVAAGREAIDMLERAIPKAADEPLTAINVNQLMRDALTVCTSRLLAQGVVVEWQPTPVLPAMMGYENRLRRTFKQIIDNALDAMSADHVHNPELQIVTQQEGEDYLSIQIIDNGGGIEESLRYKVFEPFYTTRRGHSGMGLAQVQETVNEHAGTIEISDAEHGGCCVTITLPLHGSTETNR